MRERERGEVMSEPNKTDAAIRAAVATWDDTPTEADALEDIERARKRSENAAHLTARIAEFQAKLEAFCISEGVAIGTRGFFYDEASGRHVDAWSVITVYFDGSAPHTKPEFECGGAV